MKRVLIVCSVHQETGKATAGELSWLLNQLRPDVLFLECSPADFPAFQDGPHRTLEPAVVMAYHGRNEVTLVPVDLPLPDAEPLKPKVGELFERIEAESSQYCPMDSTNRQYTKKGGFAYLNSPLNFQLESAIQREMQATVQAVGDSQLNELYELWMLTNGLREQEMISRVEEFASHTSFKKGVLLVGAAHRPSIFEKLQFPRSDGAGVVTWDFDWHHEVANLDGDTGPDDDPIDLESR